MHNFRIKFSKRLTLVFCLGLIVAFLFPGCATQNSSRQTGVTDVDPSQSMEITSIGLSEEADTMNVVIDGIGPLTYTSVKQPLPLGVVLYFPNTRLNVSKTDVQSSGKPVTSIHAGQIEAKNSTTRIEILLASDVPYNVVQDGTSLKIQFDKAIPGSGGTSNTPTSQTGATQQLGTGTETRAMDTSRVEAIKPSGAFQGTGARIGKENQIWVNRIDFLGEKDGRSTLSIETTAPVDYDIKKISDKLLELRLANANIADFRQRPLITTRFESAVNRIMPIQLPSMKNFSIFSIELREPVPYYTEQTGGLLLVHFEASSVPPAPADEANLPAWKKALEETIGPADVVSTYPKAMQLPDESQASGIKPAETTADASSSSLETALDSDQAMVLRKNIKKYTGEKIALDFFQTDIKNVFRILREVSGKNFAIDDDVSGKVTLTLDKPVPWDQVMDLVLRMNQLGMIVEGDIVRIATLATLKKENDLRNAQIASLQKEKAQIKSLEPLETRYIPISYSDATKEVLPHIQNIVTKDRGSVSVDVKNNQIIMTDTADKIANALEIARQIDKVTAQVIIEARVVEVNENYSKELGFEWNLGVGPVTVNNGKSRYSTSVAMNYPAATTNGFQLNFAKIAGTPFTLDAILTALESNGNGKILSAPKIATLNNKKAKIKQGQEIGYLERDSAGGSSVKFKDVDLMLEVTPHVTPDNRISMDIVIQKNDVTGFVDGVPVISTNEAQTQLLVNDGDTIVIGGIIKSRATKEKNAFPGLHKIPVLGLMFQSNIEETTNDELLIFMNPKIVQLEQR
ncbi:MAG: type IV pilus secretin PilQ [Deltaproteobacteria bacterium]|nr:type IV pilus secretin PilQ [Deltaproteobacteria bacterium]